MSSDSGQSSIYEEPADDSDFDSDYIGSDEYRLLHAGPSGDDEEGGDGELDGDFDRLLGPLRTADVQDDSGWHLNIEEATEFDFEEEMRISSGIGKRRTRRSRREPNLSPEVKSLLGEANTCYTKQDFARAIKLFRKVIQIEPAAPGVWATLALCHQELGQDTYALELEVMGATLSGEPDVDIWRNLAERSRNLNYIQQAIFCFRRLLNLEPDDIDALWDRSYLLMISGAPRRAAEGFMKILQYQPTNLEVLEQLRIIFIDLNEHRRAQTIFEEAFSYCKRTSPLGPSKEKGALDFGVGQIVALVDFHNNAGDYDAAVKVARQGARWLDGRLAESDRWDPIRDDREFDVEDLPREGYKPLAYYPIDMNLRQRLAISRLRKGDIDEANMHTTIVLSSDPIEYQVLYVDLAATYYELNMYEEALRIYLDLSAQNETSNITVLLQIGACHRQMANFDDAIEVYQWALQRFPDRTDLMKKLAEVYEITGRLKEALDLMNKVMEIRDQRRKQSEYQHQSDEEAPSTSKGAVSFFQETQQRRTKSKRRLDADGLTKEQVVALEQTREQDTVSAFARIDAAEESMMDGDRQSIQLWLAEVGDLIEEFRMTSKLFMSDRFAEFRGVIVQRRQRRRQGKVDGANEEEAEDELAARLQEGIAEDELHKTASSSKPVTSFRGVTFDRWKLMIFQYAFLLTREGQYPLAQEVLQHISTSNIFSTFVDHSSFHLAMMTCAVHANDTDRIIKEGRELTKAFEHNNDVTRLTLACLDGGLVSNESYTSSRYAKFIKREIKLFEDAAIGKHTSLLEGQGAHKKPKTAKGAKTTGKRREGAGVDDSDISSAEESHDASAAGEDVDSEGTDDDGEGGQPRENTDGAGRKRRRALAKDQRDPFQPTKLSPVLLTHYAQMLLCARSYQGAIYYFLQAYDLLPHDPLICLNLAVACLGRAMQRQVDNRHGLVLESISFLDHYRQFRASDDLDDEIEYNFGRAFHQLNILNLAQKHYEKALNIVTRRLENDPECKNNGCAREAAYNLSLIYVTSGSAKLAQKLYRQWLTV
ncbi:TPR-like protein [Clavulina sp. PMI_390]|nr:TPR-like protein [Clavulina sp. PMI_390]